MNVSHCPYRQSTLLQQALAPDKMRVAFLLGAGCPVSIRVLSSDGTDRPLIPDVAGLTSAIEVALAKNSTHKNCYAALVKRISQSGQVPNIEQILSHLRALKDVIRDGEINGLDQTALAALDVEICRITTSIVAVDLPTHGTSYDHLAAWIGGVARAYPVEIFTPNYDLLAEQALEAHKIPYFDGFVGSHEAFFDLASVEGDILPPRWARVWKLHGSVNWWRTATDALVRKGMGGTDERQMIYPSHLKYDESRRLPYLAMLDRLGDFLGRSQAVLVTCGYSYSDQHLNEVITDGLRGNPTAVAFALQFAPRLKCKEAISLARKHPNLTVMAMDGAVIGTVERDWRSDHQPHHPLHGLCVDPPEQEGGACRFLLGDFKRLGAFLAQQLASPDSAAAQNEA